MSGFLVQVRVEPADERHCENRLTRAFCSRLLSAGRFSFCHAFETRLVLSDDAGALRCPECLAAEREASGELTIEQVTALGKAICTP